jgi:hypothetical protein
MWEFLHGDRWIMVGKARRGRRDVVVSLHRAPKYEVMLPQIVEMADAGSSIDLISRPLGVRAAVVRDALHLQRPGSGRQSVAMAVAASVASPAGRLGQSISRSRRRLIGAERLVRGSTVWPGR